MEKVKSKFYSFKDGFFQGLGWSFGATIGFVIISTILVFFLRYIGGLPLIGKWIADIVQATEEQLVIRNPFIR